MVRHGRAAELDERAAARDRLEAMRLRTQVPGWVPEPAVVEAVEPLALSLTSPAIPPVPTGLPPALGDLARAWAMDRSPPWAHGALDRLRVGGFLMGVGLIAAAIVAGAMVFHHGSASGYSSSYDAPGSGSPVPSSSDASAVAGVGTAATSIVVDVGGRVRKPGLVTLPAGARVADAIAAAGGPLRHREIATLDLAARVSDGQLLLVGVNSDPAVPGGSDGGTDSSGAGPPAPVGLNSATIDELETLPGVGPVTAQKIIDWRTAHNGFTAVIQLQQVSGIGPARYAELSPLVTP